MNEVWEICVDVAGITLIGALAIALALVGYKMTLLPFLEAFSLCHCWRRAYGPQPVRDWFTLYRIALSYTFDHSRLSCIESYHADGWWWVGLFRWEVTEVTPKRMIKKEEGD